MQNDPVRRWMTSEFTSVSPETSLPEAYRVMKAHSIQYLPVVEDNRLVGLLSIRDLWEAQPPAGHKLNIEEMNFQLSIMKVDAVMDRHPGTLSPGMTIRQAARWMYLKENRALPVLDGDRLVGILTPMNILRALAESPEQASENAEIGLASEDPWQPGEMRRSILPGQP